MIVALLQSIPVSEVKIFYDQFFVATRCTHEYVKLQCVCVCVAA